MESARPRQRTSRTSRAQRAPALRLTERDRWLLEALAKMRFATTAQIARLFFDSPWAARKRLRRLFDAGLVRVWVRSLSEENVYSVTRAGLSVVRDPDAETALASGSSAPRGLDGNLEHLLAINQVRIALASTLPASDGELVWWRSDWELRAAGKPRLVPDALFAVRWDCAGERPFSLELDHHTKSPRRFLAKLLRYVSALRSGSGLFGVPDVIVLVVAAKPEWLERYRAAVAHVRLGLPIWFAPLADVAAGGGAAPAIWATASDDRTHSLRSLASLPYGMEGSAERIAAAARPYAPARTRLHPSRFEEVRWQTDS